MESILPSRSSSNACSVSAYYWLSEQWIWRCRDTTKAPISNVSTPILWTLFKRIYRKRWWRWKLVDLVHSSLWCKWSHTSFLNGPFFTCLVLGCFVGSGKWEEADWYPLKVGSKEHVTGRWSPNATAVSPLCVEHEIFFSSFPFDTLHATHLRVFSLDTEYLSALAPNWLFSSPTHK